MGVKNKINDNTILNYIKELKITKLSDLKHVYISKFFSHIYSEKPYIIVYIFTRLPKKDNDVNYGVKLNRYFHIEFYNNKHLIWILNRARTFSKYLINKGNYIEYISIIFGDCVDIEIPYNKKDIGPFENVEYKEINKNFYKLNIPDLKQLLRNELIHYKLHGKFSRHKISGLTNNAPFVLSLDILNITFSVDSGQDIDKTYNAFNNKEYYQYAHKIFYKYFVNFMDKGRQYVFIDLEKFKSKDFSEIFLLNKYSVHKLITKPDSIFQENYLKLYQLKDLDNNPFLFKLLFYLIEKLGKYFSFQIEKLYKYHENNNLEFDWEKSLKFLLLLNSLYNKGAHDRYLNNLCERKKAINNFKRDLKRYIINFIYNLYNGIINKNKIKEYVNITFEKAEEEYKRSLKKVEVYDLSDICYNVIHLDEIIFEEFKYKYLFNVYNEFQYPNIVREIINKIYKIFNNKNVIKELFDFQIENRDLFSFFNEVSIGIINYIKFSYATAISDDKERKIKLLKAKLPYYTLFKQNPDKYLLKNEVMSLVIKYPHKVKYLLPALITLHGQELEKLEKIINDEEISNDVIKTLSRFRKTHFYHDLIFFIDDLEKFKDLIHLYRQLSPKSHTIAQDIKNFSQLYQIYKSHGDNEKVLEIIKSIKNVNKIGKKLPVISTIINKEYIRQFEYIINSSHIKFTNEYYKNIFVTSLIRNKENQVLKDNLKLLFNKYEKEWFYDKEYKVVINELGKVNIIFSNFQDVRSIVAPEIVDCCASIEYKKFWDYYKHPYTYNLIVENGDILLWSLLVWAKDNNNNIYLVLDNIEVVKTKTIRDLLTKNFNIIKDKIFDYLSHINNDKIVKDKFFIGFNYNDLEVSRFAKPVDLTVKPLRKLYYTDAFGLPSIYLVEKH